tara:strand:+ start:6301 stop:6561 length:261 start_codon:yes stop_codon:yes gene_type:complete
MRNRPTRTFNPAIQKEDLTILFNEFLKEMVRENTIIVDVEKAIENGEVKIVFTDPTSYNININDKSIGKMRLNEVYNEIKFYKNEK